MIRRIFQAKDRRPKIPMRRIISDESRNPVNQGLRFFASDNRQLSPKRPTLHDRRLSQFPAKEQPIPQKARRNPQANPAYRPARRPTGDKASQQSDSYARFRNTNVQSDRW